MAFGTGTHETTMLCARALERYVKPGNSVIDAGCGSGILSIIAARLSAASVVAFDIDGTAVKVTEENSEINGVSSRIKAFKGTMDELPAEYKRNKADIIVANIIADVIVALSEKVPGYLKRGGLFITSGIIKERADDVIKACKDNGLALREKTEAGEWVAMVFKCQDSL